MSDINRIASALFPDDAPSPPPDWFKADHAAAEQRLTRKAEPPARDAQTDEPRDPAGPERDAAEALFKNEGVTSADYERAVGGELDAALLGAVADGDSERADALRHATSALAEDARLAGMETGTLTEALSIVRDSAESLAPPTPEQRVASFDAGMAELRAANVSDGDLAAARSFIADLEKVSPGVVASLEAHGAGNNPKLIQMVIREARRRKY